MKTLLMVAALLVLTGCGQKDGDDQAGGVSLETQVMELKAEVEELKRKVVISEFDKVFYSFAFLTPGDNGYSIIKTDMATLTVQLEDIKPFGSGSKIVLKFGNTSAASYKDVTATIDWGATDKQGKPLPESEKSKRVTLNKNLNSGAWTNVEISLEGVPPSEVGFVRISEIRNDGIRLAIR